MQRITAPTGMRTTRITRQFFWFLASFSRSVRNLHYVNRFYGEGKQLDILVDFEISGSVEVFFVSSDSLNPIVLCQFMKLYN